MLWWPPICAKDIGYGLAYFLGVFILTSVIFQGWDAWSTSLFGDSAWWLGVILSVLSLIAIACTGMYWSMVRSEKRRAAKELQFLITFYYALGDPDTRIY